MPVPQVTIVGQDGIGIGSGGMVSNPPFLGVFALGAVSNTSIAAATNFVSVKTGAGRYFGMTANTTGGGGNIVVSDGSGGTIIGGMTSNATSNGVPIAVPSLSGGVPFYTACVVVSTTSSPVSVVHFS